MKIILHISTPESRFFISQNTIFKYFQYIIKVRTTDSASVCRFTHFSISNKPPVHSGFSNIFTIPEYFLKSTIKTCAFLHSYLFNFTTNCKFISCVIKFSKTGDYIMSKLNIDQKNILTLFSDKKSDFLIPDYQRPYAWEDTECQTLWDDIFEFAIPDNDATKFNTNDEYFLGPIVTFRNKDKDNKLEIIDGQQRLTTLMLLLRAFYSAFGNMQDQNSINTKKEIEKCIWKTDEFGNPDKDALKIDSEVATDDDKDEFLTILRTGAALKQHKSKYADNYRFFQSKIDQFLREYPGYFSFLPMRVLKNCILLPIEAETQDTALQIFSTLNDRGLPLSDADIFKAQFYNYYDKQNRKDEFISRWKDLEKTTSEIFHPATGTPMDELFTRYMYYERAKQGNKSSTTEALRKFYEKNKYALLKREETLVALEALAKFWNNVFDQNEEVFSAEVLKSLCVLNFAPNGMWNYLVSVYFLQNQDKDGCLDNQKFNEFLTIITAFIWRYAITNPGVNALRTPAYAEMIKIINGTTVDFSEFKVDQDVMKKSLENFSFLNSRPITKSMLAWWAFYNKNQEMLNLETIFEIEHIFPKKRQEQERSLSDSKKLELLGNKSLLEKKINIRASDYRFGDKVKYYRGFENAKGQHKDGTHITELLTMSGNQTDFTEHDIDTRNVQILDAFIKFLEENNLLA